MGVRIPSGVPFVGGKVSERSVNGMPKFKVFLDDVRDPPEDDWVVARSLTEALALIYLNEVDVISLDNDLGENQPEGFKILDHLEEMFVEEPVFFKHHCPKEILVHSANPVRFRYMVNMIERIKNIEEIHASIGTAKGTPRR
jgi:hypothetical protein